MYKSISMVTQNHNELIIPRCNLLILRYDTCSRLGLVQILSKQNNLTIKHNSDLNSAVTELVDFLPDVVIVGYQLLLQSKFRLLSFVQNYYPNSKLLVTSKKVDSDITIKVVSSNSGLYFDDGDIGKLLLAITSTYLGSLFVDPLCVPFLAKSLLLPRDFYCWASLSDREIIAVEQLVTGKEYTEIGRDMKVSPPTVGNYIGQAIKKLGLLNRNQLIAAAVNSGFLANTC